MKIRPITVREITDSKLINAAAKQWALTNLDYLNSSNKLLGSSVKVEKGGKRGYVTAILYLQPANKVANTTLCAGAKLAGCIEGCLISSGQLGMTTGQNAATRRTIRYLLDKQGFYAQLKAEIEKEYKKHGDKLAVRLNGTSDCDFSDLIASMPSVRFYDYTKVYARILKNQLSNYDLTYSGSAFNDKALQMTARAINQGARVAIAFNTGETKGEFKVADIVKPGTQDFDETDLRFLDGAGLGYLKMKGGNKKARQASMNNDSFFFTPDSYKKLESLIASDKV